MKKLGLFVSTAAISTLMWGCDTSVEATANGSAEIPQSSATEAQNGDIENNAVDELSSSSVADSMRHFAYSSSENVEQGSLAVSSSSGSSVACGDLWCGATDTEGRVLTEFAEKEETSGYWYDYNDNDAPNYGNSKIIFPDDVEENEYGNFYGPLNQKYGGIKATIEIGDAYEYPFVGFGFNIVSENQEGFDITDWGGLCLAYSSTAGFSVEWGVANEAEVTEYNNPKANVRAALNAVVDIPWSKFSMGICCMDVDYDYIMQQVAAIKFKFEKSGDLLLTSVGRLGTCGPTSSGTPVVSSSSSAIPESSSSVVATAYSFSEKSAMTSTAMNWDGSDTEGKVVTGSAEETSGYWYSYNENTGSWYSYDDSFEGGSEVIFPSDVKEDVYGNFFGPLSKAYGGVKATFKMDSTASEPYAGLGFNIVSENQEGADISAWNGISLEYSSTVPFKVRLVADENGSLGINYVATAPMSSSPTNVSIPWSKFKPESGWGFAGLEVSVDSILSHVAEIQLEFMSDGDFLLTCIADANTGCSAAAQ